MKKACILKIVLLLLCGTAYGQKATKTVAVAIQAEGSHQLLAEDTLTSRLESEKFQFKTIRRSTLAVLKFEDIYDGLPVVISSLATEYKTELIVAGKMSYSFHKSDFFDGGIVCDMTFSYRVINKTGETVTSGVLFEHGAGFAEANSIDVAIDHISKMFLQRLSIIQLVLDFISGW